jgi:dTDP-4-amino-4,6-dideoxygalactose transaminase
MYVSSWPGMTLRELFPHHSDRRLPFPLSTENRLSFYVARSGIYHLFRALGFNQGDVVLVPDYHSGNEVAAIRAAGASIVYYPIRRNLEPDLDKLADLARLRPRVVYVIHYLGWPQPMREIAEIFRECGSVVIEDCALSLLSESEGRPLGSFGDYSVFCLYKTLPVPNGGLLVQNRELLPPLAALELQRCPRASLAGRSAELLLEALRTRSNGVGKALFDIKRAVGRTLRAVRMPQVPVGDIGWNLANVNIAMSGFCNSLMQGLDYDSIRRRRRENFLLLRERLAGQVAMPREDLPEGVCPLFFPILVQDKHEAAKALWNQGIGAVEFWNGKAAAANGEHRSDAQYLRDHVLELPIHQDVATPHVHYIADQIERLRLERPQ